MLMKKIWVTIAMLLIAVHARPVLALTGKVTHVTDGDSLWVRPGGGGKPVNIRLAGIDAPEICQSGGRAARLALAQRVQGRTVTVFARRQDDYGRTVATIYLDDEDTAAWMVSQGHAWAYRYDRKGRDYRALQSRAQAARRGLFADPAALEPRLFRKGHGPCRR